jgi:hypothetical protein
MTLFQTRLTMRAITSLILILMPAALLAAL